MKKRMKRDSFDSEGNDKSSVRSISNYFEQLEKSNIK